MPSRTRPAAALCLAIAAAAAALYFVRPALTAVAVVFAAAGWLAAALLRRGAIADRSPGEANGGGRGAPSPAARGGVAPGAGDVPAGELLEAMLGSMREGLVVVDGGMRVVALNTPAREILGAGSGGGAAESTERPHAGGASALQSGELRSLGELTRDPAVLGAFAEALAHGLQVGAKVETGARDRRAYDLRVAPLKPREGWGARRGAVGVFFDVTRLERLERVRQEFLLNVSHELRTPLTAIRTFVETLGSGVVDEAAHNRRFLSIIDRNAARMQHLIDDILELSAIEAGRVSVEPRPVPLRPLVQDVLTALAGRAAGRGVTLHNEVAADVVVFADVRRLEQMLTNLADNAVKFNRAGGEVRIRHARDGARDRVLVADTGDGIAPEHAARIFERFYRVDRARSRELGGTGLGLAIVKHLARAHGGEVGVTSTAGEGTTFTVELPATRVVA